MTICEGCVGPSVIAEKVMQIEMHLKVELCILDNSTLFSLSLPSILSLSVCVCRPEGQRRMLCFLVYQSPPYSLEAGSLTELEFVISPRLSANGSLGPTHLSTTMLVLWL